MTVRSVGSRKAINVRVSHNRGAFMVITHLGIWISGRDEQASAATCFWQWFGSRTEQQGIICFFIGRYTHAAQRSVSGQEVQTIGSLKI